MNRTVSTTKAAAVPSKEKATKSAFRENAEAIFVAIILALVIRTFVVQAFKIPSGSMKETLLIGDQILVNKFAYGVKIPFLGFRFLSSGLPERGDIIVFKFPEEPEKDFIKRVIGLPGDTIAIRDKQVFVNGEPFDLPQAVYNDDRVLPKEIQPRDNLDPVTVPDDSLFVMGDNRDSSYDSRFWGFVDTEAVKGKAFIIYWSWDKTRSGIRFGRIGHILN